MHKVAHEPRRCCYHPEGPFTTGCLDVMIGKDKNGTLFRLYYPTALTDIDEHRECWALWYPGEKYAEGLAKAYSPAFSGIYTHIANKYTKKARIPSIWEAPVAKGKFPLVVFSHGLTAHRTLYSGICNDLASHGFVVASVEHRDGSACGTFTLTPDGKKDWISYKKLQSNEDELQQRYLQLRVRAEECMKALDVLTDINAGRIEKNDLQSDFNLERFEDRFDLSQIAMAGHSFGGATTILTLSMDDRFNVGVCLDPWMFPLSFNDLSSLSITDPSRRGLEIMSKELKQPLLFILMDGFQEQMNLQKVNLFKNERNVFKTILGTVHQNQTDTPFLFEKDNYILKRFIDCMSKRPHLQAMTMNNRLIISFLCKTFNLERCFVEPYDISLHDWIPMIMDGSIGNAKSMLGWSSYKPLVQKNSKGKQGSK